MPDVVIIMAKCAKRGESWAIRFEGRGSQTWEATWSFPMAETSGRKEHYTDNRISGDIRISGPEWRGCPHCSHHGLFLCVCDKLSCWDGESSTATCGWCGSSGELGGRITSLSGTGNY